MRYMILFLCCHFTLVAQDTLTILFAGDAMMHRAQIENGRSGDTFDLSGYFSHIEKEIRSADLAVVNLEAPLGGAPYRGYPAFSAPDAFARTLQEAGFDFFLLANNHCLDRSTRGLVRTVRQLDSLQISHTGVFLDSLHRSRRYPMLLRKKGFRLIMLNYTYATNGLRVDSPRIVNYMDKSVMAADIAEAKLFNPDFIIAHMHWGEEYKQKPSHEQKALADWLIDQGVDLIIGSHPHVIQPMELRKSGEGGDKDRLIVYSLGNFISNMTAENTYGGALVKAVLCRKGLKRSIASAKYGLVFCDRYQKNDGKQDLRLLPAALEVERSQTDSLPANQKLLRFVDHTRLLLKRMNIGVEEYIFE